MIKVILYIATSQDGFIADSKGGVDWLPQPKEGEDYGYRELLNNINIIVMGSKSYVQILEFGEWTWSDKQTSVFTSQDFSKHPNIKLTRCNPRIFLEKIQNESIDQNIWLLGGAKLVKSFAQDNLIDKCIITIIPKILGKGIKLDLPYLNFNLTDTKEYNHGIIQKFYVKKKL